MNSKKTKPFPHDYKSLGSWFLLTYMIFGPILEFLRSFSFEAFNIFDGIYFVLTSSLSFFLFFYISYIILYKFYPRNKGYIILGLIPTLIIPILFRFFIEEKLSLWLFGLTNYYEGTTLKYYFIDNTYPAAFYIPFGVVYYFFMRSKNLQKEKIEAEQLKIRAELQHLRSQVNPHFLFNSLNNIYSLAYDRSSNILPAIENLSELLRYALYENSEYVPFAIEWSKIEQFITLEQLRVANPVDFEIDIQESVNEVPIPPLILLSLIENVFKHGEIQNPKTPCTINASIKRNDLMIEILNQKKQASNKDKLKGIGIQNIVKRLNHLYNERANIIISENETTFKVNILIPIK